MIQLLEKCLIASQTGIAGCVIIEDEVLFGDK
jgi:UDP-3-O-[3-hydroxymyristoyl] glucosamine N-acyltransferase